VDELPHARYRDKQKGAIDEPVEKEAKHLSRVKGRLCTHDVGNVGNGREDGMEKDTTVRAMVSKNQ
jgi:hypothetical protein